MAGKTTLTECQIEFLLKAWKNKTLTQIAEEMGEPDTNRINIFYNKHRISPMTKRELIAKELFKIRDSGVCAISINEVAAQLNTSFATVRDVINEYGIGLKTKQEIGAIKEKLLNDFDCAIKHTKESRSELSVYTQTGSNLTDELRGIKTTKREKTLLSNGKL